MQRLYRGERAQRGRFREFYQCDVDVLGKDTLSLRFDAEVPALIYNIFSELDIGPFTTQINNRKLMRVFFAGQGIAAAERPGAVLREGDTRDKHGRYEVLAPMAGPGFEAASSEDIGRP